MVPRPARGPTIIPRPKDWTTLAGWSQLGWLAAALSAWSVLLLGFSLDPDYTSGELLDHLASWRETGVLYPPVGSDPPFRVMNYPPLVLLLARLLAGAGLPELAAGRVATAAGVVALLAAVGWWVRARGVAWHAVAGTVGLLGASFPVLYGAGQFHIEPWASALTVAGFAALDRGGSRRAAALAGVALALACFAKHSQLVPALVALGWAWGWRKGAAPIATAAFAAVGVAGSAALTAAFGAEAWRHMITYTVGGYALANLGHQALLYAAPWAVFLASAIHLVRRRGRSAPGDGAVWFFGVAFLWSLAAARVGASHPYFLDLHLATAVLVGPWIFAGAASPRPTGGWRWLLVAQVVGANVGVGTALWLNVHRLQAVEAALPRACAALGAGPLVLTEEAGVARACGHAPALHPFAMAALARDGRWDPASMADRVGDGAYPAALLGFDPRQTPGPLVGERWPDPLLQAFARASAVTPLAPGLWEVRW